jgi:epoxyqueuosine reductase QueG
LLLLKEELEDYLSFISVRFVVCDVCLKTVPVKKFAFHIEEFHFESERPWNKEKRKRMGIDGPAYLQRRAERWLKKHGYKD